MRILFFHGSSRSENGIVIAANPASGNSARVDFLLFINPNSLVMLRLIAIPSNPIPMKLPFSPSALLIGTFALALGACATSPSTASAPAAAAPAPIASAPTFAANIPDNSASGGAAKPATSETAPAAPAAAPQPTVVAAKIDFDSQVKPFFSTYCLQCHGPGRRASGIRFDTAAGLNAAKRRIPGALNSNMPPEGQLQPSDAERAMITQWVSEGGTISDSYPSGAPAAAPAQ
jgi:hypothetical protein